jgi:predicted enzyme related to lactoylglutathione lyase
MAASEPTAEGRHPLVHVEIPASDAEKLKGFYTQLFGWQFTSAPGMETYAMAGISGGEPDVGVAIFPRENEGARLTNYYLVDSVGAYAERLTTLGGQVAHRFTVSGMGHGAIAFDPEGNPLGLWQNDSGATEG